MPSCQRILADINNAVARATLNASAVLPAERQVFRQQTARSGNGVVRLDGAYSGADDTLIEVEIRPASGAVAPVTQPTFSGAGNGAMTQPTAINGSASQDVTVTLVNLGTTTVAAQAILYAAVVVLARTPGMAGNAITLSIAPDLALVTPPVGVLGDDLARGTQEWADQKLDFGAVPLNPDGTVPSNAPRLVFGRDVNQVYRHYKRWDGDQWQYGVSPKLATAYTTGALVNTVTGSYTATVSDGVTTENYPNLVTLYDLLLALSGSALVVPGTPPANDLKPGEMAAIDVPFRTNAFALPVEKSRAELPDLTGITVTATAPTESVSLECTSAAQLNAETWKVTSQVAGALPNATTGTAYGAGFVGFTIPTRPVETRPISGRIGLSDVSFVTRATGEGEPDICLYQPLLGAAASNKTLELVWTQRTPADCLCTDSSVNGQPIEELLGVDLGETAMTALVAGHRARLEALASWLKGFVAANTATTTAGELRSAEYDIQLASLAAVELNDCLDDIYTDADAIVAEAAWTVNTAYAVDDVVESASRNGYRYRATIAGTSGVSAPAWPTTIGNTITDGTVTWKCVSKTAPLTWDAVLSGLSTDLSGLSAIGTEAGVAIPKWAATTAYATGAVVFSLSGSTLSYLRCIGAGTSTSTNPSSTGLQLGDSIADGTVIWMLISRNEAYMLKSGDAGDINSVDSLVDDPAILRTPEEFVKRYIAACDEVRAIAGLPPKKSDAGLKGNRVWRDLGSDYWVFASEDYLPAFCNTYYHAAVKDCDGTPIPTYEFGFAIRVGCPERLKYGDTLTIAIGDVAIQRAYQVGDVYKIPVVHGSPLALAGGVTGDDTLTWIVRGSVSGALPDYALGPTEVAYSASGLAFTIHRGGIPFALGDAFFFAVETGGQFRWRQDNGAWSADTDLTASVELTDDLTAVFSEGVAPSFVAGDFYRFLVRQPYSPSHVKSADGALWRWPDADATLTIDFGADTLVECLGVLRHTLQLGAILTLTLQDAMGTTLYTFAPTVHPGPLLVFPETPVTARRLAVTLEGAIGMALGWVYAGSPWAATHDADQCVLRRAYALERGTGVDPSALYLGAGRGGELTWTNWFMPDDWVSLLALLDDIKSRGDVPVVVTPNLTDTADAALARIATDLLELTDEYRFNDPSARQMSVTLPLTAIVV